MRFQSPHGRRDAMKHIAITGAGLALSHSAAYSDEPNRSANRLDRDQKDQGETSLNQSLTKKGIGGKGSLCELTNAGWYYNWYWHPSPGKIDAEFVPMIKGKSDANDKSFAKIAKLKKSHQISHLLGFNEPDSEKQGNTSVDRAIQLWPQLMATQLRLGSPAVTDNRRGREWFDAFMAKSAAKQYRIDFVAVHRYPNINGPNSIKPFLNSLYQVYQKYRLPIWITEFAGLNFGSKDRKMSAATNLWFMRQVLPILEQLPYVERYAWFSSGPKENSSLYIQNQPGQLNTLGKFYRSIGT
ncbi:glycosyl hydrolase [Novipirellula sp. SH528]|uniref:glycosyl hydrolase n=1 Tax=Novipirellula sp. SH528 TaxID=3454466 RepID=UPI003FA10674